MMHHSVLYQKVKSSVRTLIVDTHSPYKKYYDKVMVLLIVSSISILVASKTHKVPQYLIDFDLYAITSIFALEYVLRVWISDDMHYHIFSAPTHVKTSTSFWGALGLKLRYMLSLPALIDLVAIFPDFRIMRSLKLFRHMHGASSLFNALLKKRFEFLFLGYMLFAVTFSFGAIFYLLEHGVNDSLHTFLDAVYWALITISTVGYGDISPVTDLGKIVAMFGIIFGIAMISFATSIMVSAFSQRFDELRNQDSINHVNKMRNVVIVNGYGHLGATVVKQLKHHTKFEPVIVENDEKRVAKAQEEGYKAIYAEGSSMSIIDALYKNKNIIAMLSLRSSDIENIYFILNAKSIYANSVIYSRINDVALHTQYKATKVDGLVETYDTVDTKAFQHLMRSYVAKKQMIYFFGYTQKSSQICIALKEAGVAVTIYEMDEERCRLAHTDGFACIELMGRESHEELPISEGIVVCAMNDEAYNVYLSISLRSKGFDGEIVVLSDSREENKKFILAGANRIFDMYEESASKFIEILEEKINKAQS